MIVPETQARPYFPASPHRDSRRARSVNVLAFCRVGTVPGVPDMTLTLLCGVAGLALSALFAVKPFDASASVMLDPTPDLSDRTVETLVGNSGHGEALRGDWHVTQVDTLRDAEDC